jgi:microcystin-dependent protein
MAVPLPVVFTAGALPAGFKGNLQQTLNAFADALSATVDGTFLTGQIGGTAPAHDIGPWLDGASGTDWYFWDPATGQYQPSEQGTPVGIMTVWGGEGAPANWLLCDGREVPTATYDKLFRAIGYTWGAPADPSLFKLPPSFTPAVGTTPATPLFFVGASGFAPVNTRGGAGSTMIVALQHLPALWAQVHATHFTYDSSGETPADYVAGETATPGSARWPVMDGSSVVFGNGQVGLPTIPPWIAANYIIKYQ